MSLKPPDALVARVYGIFIPFVGQCMAIKLLEAGFDSVLLLERSATVGGT